MSEHVAQHQLPKLVRRLPDMRVTINDHEMSSRPVITRQRDNRARRSPFLWSTSWQSFQPRAPCRTGREAIIVRKGGSAARREMGEAGGQRGRRGLILDCCLGCSDYFAAAFLRRSSASMN